MVNDTDTKGMIKQFNNLKIVVKPQNVRNTVNQANKDPAEVKKGLTPYQGDRRTFGFFKCTKCSKTWSSAFSWADTFQKCLMCKINIYPHKQRPMHRRKKDNIKRLGHQENDCGKCLRLGFSCTEISFDRNQTGEETGKRRRRRRNRSGGSKNQNVEQNSAPTVNVTNGSNGEQSGSRGRRRRARRNKKVNQNPETEQI